jgi:pyrroloquinoline-quinone synthase
MQETLRQAVAETLARYDLLTHPFYTAWSRGELTRAQLHQYGEQYLQHVAAFPTYLTALHARLPEGPTRRAVLNNAFEEEADGRSHADLWRDFIAGMASTEDCHLDRSAQARSGETCISPDRAATLPEIAALVATFRETAQTASPACAIAAFHAYESQVPRIAATKRKGLVEHYGADAATCEYFRVHETADVHHAKVWTSLLEQELAIAAAKGPEAVAACEAEILHGTELAAKALWVALDGIEGQRLASGR